MNEGQVGQATVHTPMATARIDSTPRQAGGGPPSSAARLDRLPTSKWLVTTMVILFLGWLVESYDIGLIGNVLPSLTKIYHMGSGEKSLVSISSTIGIVVGIIPAGYLADRFGRKRLFLGGIVIYSVITLATGFATSPSEVVALRLLAGLGMGAVFPMPYVLGSELCPRGLRGRFTGMADSFLSVGYFLAPLIAIWVIPSTTSAGWRTMFFIGGIPLLYTLVIAKWLPESPRWLESKGRHAEADRVLSDIEAKVRRSAKQPLPEPVELVDLSLVGPGTKGRVPLRTLFTSRYLKRSLMLWVTFGGVFFIFYSIQIYMPTVVTKMGYSLTSAFVFTSIIVGVSIPGKYLESMVVERWGRKPVIISFTLLAAAAAFAFGFVRGAVPVILVGSFMSFFGISVDPAVKVYTAEQYPTSVRATGTNATEGFGRLISGIIGPAIVPFLLVSTGVVGVFSVVGGVAVIAVIIVATMGRETRGVSLEELNEKQIVTGQPMGAG